MFKTNEVIQFRKVAEFCRRLYGGGGGGGGGGGRGLGGKFVPPPYKRLSNFASFFASNIVHLALEVSPLNLVSYLI